MSDILLDVHTEDQPDSTTCGPTSLNAVYRYWGDEVALATVIEEAESLDDGGTLAVLLGTHALRRGYDVTLYSFNLALLDPTWFTEEVDLRHKLQQQAKVKSDPKLTHASAAYSNFLELGGKLRMEDLSADLVSSYLKRKLPVLAGVSATYLYGCARELPDGAHDDLRGTTQGHFVVLTGMRRSEIQISDPWADINGPYWVDANRLITAVLLGVLSFDGNLLVIQPR